MAGATRAGVRAPAMRLLSIYALFAGGTGLAAILLLWPLALAIWLTGLAVLAVTIRRIVTRPIDGLSDAMDRWRGGLPPEWPSPRVQGFVVRRLATSIRRATHELTLQRQRVLEATRRQELAMQEIHHRVKNNLQVVASLLNLQASRIRQPEARAEFQSARDRIRALATLHRHLYVYGEIHTIDMGEFLDELCGQLFKALGETPGGRLTLSVDAPAIKVSSDQAVPLALIVTEAVTNAVKYAFPYGRTGHISIVLRADKDHATLEIADDGIGIPSGRQQTEAGMRDGIGLQLINGFAQQLNATLLLDEVVGTRYVVTFPLRPARFDSPAIVGA